MNIMKKNKKTMTTQHMMNNMKMMEKKKTKHTNTNTYTMNMKNNTTRK